MGLRGGVGTGCAVDRCATETPENSMDPRDMEHDQTDPRENGPPECWYIEFYYDELTYTPRSALGVLGIDSSFESVG